MQTRSLYHFGSFQPAVRLSFQRFPIVPIFFIDQRNILLGQTFQVV